MTITTIDPTAALIVIDLQQGIAGAPTIHPSHEVAARGGELAAAFRERDLPVVLVSVSGVAPGRTDQGGGTTRTFGADFADLLPEVNQQPGDHTLTKYRWGAFEGTDLLNTLHDLGVTQVVVVGISTSAGVESTARSAHGHGFHVTIATDAVTDTNASAHENSLTAIFPRMAETGTVAEIINALPR
ncbi:isochorismatase family protein [Williamsia sterculiae]|uniref:Nicotinamidase-related amidase n=1 Tax=Williamsia sterculiae TaxID=1344003 RepID=A0A1N7D0D1_9NOCA|nr:isochorismatase family protein [Williamsia sterculiae]SIR69336.1 Nicotinamidase-related amidase [Williamsia sterculiae]